MFINRKAFFRVNITLFLIFATIGAGQIAHAESVTEYVADFATRCDDWSLERFNCSNGLLTASTTGYSGNALLEDRNWEVHEIRSRFTILSYGLYGSVRFTWGNQDAGDFYALTFGEAATILWRFDDGVATNLGGHNALFKAVAGETYDVRIVINGNQFEAYIDDKLILRTTDPENRYPVGQVGIRASNTVSTRIESYSVKGTVVE